MSEALISDKHFIVYLSSTTTTIKQKRRNSQHGRNEHWRVEAMRWQLLLVDRGILRVP